QGRDQAVTVPRLPSNNPETALQPRYHNAILECLITTRITRRRYSNWLYIIYCRLALLGYFADINCCIHPVIYTGFLGVLGRLLSAATAGNKTCEQAAESSRKSTL